MKFDSRIQGDAFPKRRPAFWRRADVLEDGAAAAGWDGGRLDHLHALLPGGPASGVRLRTRRDASRVSAGPGSAPAGARELRARARSRGRTGRVGATARGRSNPVASRPPHRLARRSVFRAVDNGAPAAALVRRRLGRARSLSALRGEQSRQPDRPALVSLRHRALAALGEAAGSLG